MKKTRIVLVFTTIIYVLGVLIFIYPRISNLMSNRTSRVEIQKYEKQVDAIADSKVQTILEQASTFNQNLSIGIIEEALKRCLNQENDMMCYVDIPKIHVYLPVYYGTGEESLEKGCGYLENSSLPVGGVSTHSVIAGHTGLPTADMFTYLDEMKEGDLFYIHVLGNQLAYRVVSVNSVSPNDTDLLRVVQGKDYVTLLTCTPYGINDKRLLVLGERVIKDTETQKEDTDNGSLAQSDNESNVNKEMNDLIREQEKSILMIIVTAIVVYGIAVILMLKLNGKDREGNRGSKNKAKTSAGADSNGTSNGRGNSNVSHRE